LIKKLMSSSPPLFILAPAHSLAPWVNAALGQHPQLEALPSILLLTQELIRMPHRLEWQNALIGAIAQARWERLDETALDWARHWLLRQSPRNGASMRLTLADWIAPRQMVERNLCYLHPKVLDRIQRLFPEAYYLHLTCHPVLHGRAAGRWRVRSGQRPALIDLTRTWLMPVLITLEFFEGLPREKRLTLRGEDFLKEPANYLGQLIKWLGLNEDRDAIATMLHPERWPFAETELDWAAFSDDREFLAYPGLPIARGWPDHTEEDIAPGMTHEIRHYARLLGYTENDQSAYSE